MRRVGLAGLVIAVLGVATAAQAVTGAKWTISRMPPQPTGSNLVGVSCANAEFLRRRWLQRQRDLGGELGRAGVDDSTDAQPPREWRGLRHSRFGFVPVGDRLHRRRVSAVTTSCTPGCHFRTSTLAKRWSGDSWTILSTPALRGNSSLSGVSCVSAINCIAVGKKGSTTLAEHWDGETWQGQPGPRSHAAPSSTGLMPGRERVHRRGQDREQQADAGRTLEWAPMDD